MRGLDFDLLRQQTSGRGEGALRLNVATRELAGIWVERLPEASVMGLEP